MVQQVTHQGATGAGGEACSAQLQTHSVSRAQHCLRLTWPEALWKQQQLKAEQEEEGEREEGAH